MSLSERQRQFEAAVKADGLVGGASRVHKLFGVSNSAKIVRGGIQLGVVNLDGVVERPESLVLLCMLVFPPADEVYFSVYVKSGSEALLARLDAMKGLGSSEEGAADYSVQEAAVEYETPPSDEVNEADSYAARNNNVAIAIDSSGRLRLKNKRHWDEVPEGLFDSEVPIPVDKIQVAIFPPTASARRSLVTREFVGYLGGLVGQENVHELKAWDASGDVRPSMRRMPGGIDLDEIERAVKVLGGHYPHGEVRRMHSSLNFLPHKHFVILSGLSGTGKTQLALHYARAVHGLSDQAETDPFLFVCPVRPEWTDPSGLTGYYDVLTNRYVVPSFLEAVLVATAHPDSPVFVVLDEMNLARVEYYFSDVLSCIETREPLLLHSNAVPLEGSNGVSIPSRLPVPANLYLVGTVNIDETTSSISDKVLDRALVIDMSSVDLDGFLAMLTDQEKALGLALDSCRTKLSEVHACLSKHELGFGYRLAEEVVRYFAFHSQIKSEQDADVLDELMTQKVLVKIRGTEKQRSLLAELKLLLDGMPLSLALIGRLEQDLDEFGSFQASR